LERRQKSTNCKTIATSTCITLVVIVAVKLKSKSMQAQINKARKK